MSKVKDILNKVKEYLLDKAAKFWLKLKELIKASRVGEVIDRFLRANGASIIMAGLTAWVFTYTRQWWGFLVVAFMLVGILKSEVCRHKIIELEDELAKIDETEDDAA